MTPEELARERAAYLERRRKALAAELQHEKTPSSRMGMRGFYVMKKTDRAKIRESEYVPPPSVAR